MNISFCFSTRPTWRPVLAVEQGPDYYVKLYVVGWLTGAFLKKGRVIAGDKEALKITGVTTENIIVVW